MDMIDLLAEPIKDFAKCVTHEKTKQEDLFNVLVSMRKLFKNPDYLRSYVPQLFCLSLDIFGDLIRLNNCKSTRENHLDVLKTVIQTLINYSIVNSTIKENRDENMIFSFFVSILADQFEYYTEFNVFCKENFRNQLIDGNNEVFFKLKEIMTQKYNPKHIKITDTSRIAYELYYFLKKPRFASSKMSSIGLREGQRVTWDEENETQ